MEEREQGVGTIVMVNRKMQEEKKTGAEGMMEISTPPPPALSLALSSPAREAPLRT